MPYVSNLKNQKYAKIEKKIKNGLDPSGRYLKSNTRLFGIRRFRISKYAKRKYSRQNPSNDVELGFLIFQTNKCRHWYFLTKTVHNCVTIDVLKVFHKKQSNFTHFHAFSITQSITWQLSPGAPIDSTEIFYLLLTSAVSRVTLFTRHYNCL